MRVCMRIFMLENAYGTDDRADAFVQTNEMFERLEFSLPFLRSMCILRKKFEIRDSAVSYLKVSVSEGSINY